MAWVDPSAPEVSPSAEVMFPGTGELLDVREPANAILALEAARQAKRRLDDYIAEVSGVVEEEMARRGTQTIHVGRKSLVRRFTPVYEWDHEELHTLVDMGLPAERYRDLVKHKSEVRVDVREANRLAAANPEYARVIEGARTQVGHRMTVDVKYAKE